MNADMKFEILVVEDTPASLKLVSDMLTEEGYQVRPANSGELALASVEAKLPDLILLDIRMPGLNGFEVCEKLKEDKRPQDIPIIFLSAFTEADQHVKGFELGAVDFVTKPFERVELLARVRTHLELTQLRNNLADEVKRKTEELQKSHAQVLLALNGIITATGNLLEMRDPYTAKHQRSVASISTAIAIEMGLDDDQVKGIKMGSLIHDIGKISIATELLVKPTKLSEIEYMMIKNHAENGYQVLSGIEFPWPIAEMAYQHHERMNGSGYPQGLKGDDIIPEARIIAVADVVEAMSSNRPYRPGLGIEAALDEIEKNRGTLYDEVASSACITLFREKGYTFPD